MLGYVGLMAYVAVVKDDLFALGMGAFGAFGGLGFPLGQTVQVWGRSARPFGERVQSWIDWWKVMELTFGAAAGGALGVGWWALREIGLSTGREGLPHVSAPFQIALLAVFAGIFVAAEMRFRFASVPMMAPFSVAIFLMLPAFSAGASALFILGGLLCATASIGIARSLYRDELVGGAVAILVAALGVAAAIAAGTLLGGPDTRFWLLFVVWFQTAATVSLKGLRRPVLIPSDDMVARHGVWVARLRGAGSALPVEMLFVVMAGLLTWVVTAQ